MFGARAPMLFSIDWTALFADTRTSASVVAACTAEMHDKAKIENFFIGHVFLIGTIGCVRKQAVPVRIESHRNGQPCLLLRSPLPRFPLRAPQSSVPAGQPIENSFEAGSI